MKGSILNNAAISSAVLIGANLAQAKFCNSNMRQTNLSYALLTEVQFNEAELSRANFIASNLKSSSLVGIKASGANFLCAFLQGSDLSRAQLSRTYMRYTTADINTIVTQETNIRLADGLGSELSLFKDYNPPNNDMEIEDILEDIQLEIGTLEHIIDCFNESLFYLTNIKKDLDDDGSIELQFSQRLSREIETAKNLQIQAKDKLNQLKQDLNEKDKHVNESDVPLFLNRVRDLILEISEKRQTITSSCHNLFSSVPEMLFINDLHPVIQSPTEEEDGEYDKYVRGEEFDEPTDDDARLK
jgi:uncharacterized protein YjbI with pentapeptide repeats